MNEGPLEHQIILETSVPELERKLDHLSQNGWTLHSFNANRDKNHVVQMYAVATRPVHLGK